MEMVRDCPTLMRHLWNEFFSVGGLMLMFRIRIVLCFVAGLMYVFSPLDIIPEGVFGVLGLLDDIFVMFLLAMYVSIIYRRLVVSRRMATWYTISLFFAVWHICDTSFSFVCMHYFCIFWYGRTPLTRAPVIRIASYPVRLYSTVLWLLLCERWSPGSPFTRFGLALRVNLSRILQNWLALKLPDIIASIVQCYGF